MHVGQSKLVRQIKTIGGFGAAAATFAPRPLLQLVQHVRWYSLQFLASIRDPLPVPFLTFHCSPRNYQWIRSVYRMFECLLPGFQPKAPTSGKFEAGRFAVTNLKIMLTP
jgi:hypothetical protein